VTAQVGLGRSPEASRRPRPLKILVSDANLGRAVN
jgi:hypothetical protein